MDVTADSKLFVQLRPDAAAIDYLQTLQANLSESQNDRLVNKAELHLTVVHIGLVARLLTTLRPHSPLSDAAILQQMNLLAIDLALLTSDDAHQEYSLQPLGLEKLGRKQTVCAVTLRATDRLSQLHTASLQRLQQFLVACGITDATRFMAADDNLQYALSLKPHIALAKSYYNGLPDFDASQPITCCMMPIAY